MPTLVAGAGGHPGNVGRNQNCCRGSTMATLQAETSGQPREVGQGARQMGDKDVHEGGCLCGAVRYATNEAPLRVHICCCRFCQRSTGSNMMVEPLFERAAHAVIGGAPDSFELPSGGSGKMIKIHFCGACGTKLFQEFERVPNLVGVYAGTFDQPDWFERTPANTRYIFLESAQDGTIIPPGFNTYQQSHSHYDGTPLEPTVYEQPHVIRRG